MVKRESKRIERLKEKMKELQQGLRGIGPVMRGSIVYIGTKSKQYYLSLNKNQKTKIIFLGNRMPNFKSRLFILF